MFLETIRYVEWNLCVSTETEKGDLPPTTEADRRAGFSAGILLGRWWEHLDRTLGQGAALPREFPLGICLSGVGSPLHWMTRELKSPSLGPYLKRAKVGLDLRSLPFQQDTAGQHHAREKARTSTVLFPVCSSVCIWWVLHTEGVYRRDHWRGLLTWGECERFSWSHTPSLHKCVRREVMCAY